MINKIKKVKSSLKGFTLTELLVVVLVIGVLAAIALPAYTKSVRKSRVSDALNNLNIVSMKQQDYLLNNERYAESFKILNVPISGLSSDGKQASAGQFDYQLNEACVYANSKNEGYQLVKNVESQKTGCISGAENDFCSLISDLVPTVSGSDTIDCAYVPPNDGGGSGITPQPKDCGGSCTKTCWDGSSSSGICNQNTGVCDFTNSTCPPVPQTKECLDAKPSEKEACGTKCGYHTRTVKCNQYTGAWETDNWGQCSDEGECTPNEQGTQACEEGKTGEQVRTCTSSCTWGSWNTSNCKDPNACDDPNYAKEHACECKPSDSTCCAGNPKSKWDAAMQQCVCPSGKYETKGICCLTGQVSLDGKKCIYEYTPERVNVGILANCHDFYSTMGKRKDCSVGRKEYYEGGSAPVVNAGSKCEAHIAYYWESNKMWKGGKAVYGGGTCDASKTDAQLCSQYCTAATCSFTCMRSQSVPSKCPSYKCSNGYHCDNAKGSGVMLRCKRKY